MTSNASGVSSPWVYAMPYFLGHAQPSRKFRAKALVKTQALPHVSISIKRGSPGTPEEYSLTRLELPLTMQTH